MKRILKNLQRVILSILLFLSFQSVNAIEIETVRADKKAATSFAIFVDKATYQACRAEIMAYRDVLQQEGLGTYILSAHWETPDQVKAEIVKLSKMTPKLEGMVFIGDIPIVRVRKGQFFTTAFKMNETTFPREESSVTSDRFYEDLKLKFELIDRDSLNTNHFYYNLTSEGAVKLDPEFYSGRIVVPDGLTGDKHELMRDYLRKVVDAHHEQNSLDDFIFFAGHGYNSDCMTVWREEQMAFREYFPDAFQRNSTNKFLNFRQDPYIKFQLYNEIQRKDVDLFMFTEHGSVDKQHINGAFPAGNYSESIEELKREIRSAYVRRYRGTDKEAQFKEDVMKEYGLSASVFSDDEIEKYRQSDSAANANINILLPDIAQLKSGPRWIVFNACYNGSFHQPEFIAGYHLFNGGNTIVTQGNTVNVLQDKWAEQLIGYLALGVRAGLWQKEVLTLESHLVGDPTFRFAPDKSISKAESERLNLKLATGRNDLAYWNELLESKDARLRATAIKQLSKYYQERAAADLEKFSDRLLEIFSRENSWTVRMQALKELSSIRDANFTAAVNKGFNDPYELIVRQSATFAGKIGDPVLIPGLIDILLFHTELQRLQYAAPSALSVFEGDMVISEYKAQKEGSHLMPELLNNENDATLKSLVRSLGWGDDYLKTIGDKDAKPSAREGAIRYLRNNQIHHAIDLFGKVLNDTNESDEIRILMAEALGWFEYSYRKDDVAAALRQCLSSANISSELRDTVQKSLKRVL